MKAPAAWICVQLLMLSLCVPAALAQTGSATQQRYVYTQAELDQMLAPIALYPDPLLSQILMAATYPLEVVEAARWSRAHPGLKADDAVRAVDDRDWDPSVKSLVAFPEILAMMDQKLDWTERLGDAFLGQQDQVMDTVQQLRRKAAAAGNLQSNDRQRVESDQGSIVIEPLNPDVVYVPYYNPVVVYGNWWWPNYPPVYWPPWPGYYITPGFVGLGWGAGVVVGANFFFGAWDWHHHHVRIGHARPFYYHAPRRPSGQRPGRPVPSPGSIWHHNPEHRLGVPYRNPVVRRHFRPNIGSSAQRREYRGFVSPQPKPGSTRPGPGARPARPIPAERPNAFEWLGQGHNVQRYSERGRQSLQRGGRMSGGRRSGDLPIGLGGRVPGSGHTGDLPIGLGGRVPGSRRQSGGR